MRSGDPGRETGRDTGYATRFGYHVDPGSMAVRPRVGAGSPDPWRPPFLDPEADAEFEDDFGPEAETPAATEREADYESEPESEIPEDKVPDDAPEPDRFPVFHMKSKAATMRWLLPTEASSSGIAADEAAIGDLEVRAASVIGAGHRTRTDCRQDAYRIARDASGRHLIVAVADGMSDSKHSDIGANVAVAALIAALRKQLEHDMPGAVLNASEAFLAAAGQMANAAEVRGWSAEAVRAVAVAAVIETKPNAQGRYEVWLASIGDAAAWTLRDGDWESQLARKSSDGFGNEVEDFLPHCHEPRDVGRFSLGRGEALLVATDGVADAFATVPDAAPWFAERWREPVPVERFLVEVAFDQTQMLDDRTAVMVWCGTEPSR